jgi:cytochrome bd-type quinol oxidase subunit 1
MSRDKDEKAAEALAGCAAVCIAFVMLPWTAILNGWALAVLWAWFVVTTFEARPLRVVEAIGLSMVVSFLVHQRQPDSDEPAGKQVLRATVHSIVTPLIALGIGWVVHRFM